MALNIFGYLSLILTVISIISCTKSKELTCLRCFDDMSKFEQNTSTMKWSLNYNTNNESLCSIDKTTANHLLLNISFHQGESEYLKFTNEYFCNIQNGDICFYRGFPGYPNKFKCQMTSSPVEEINMFDINWQAICKCLFYFYF